ncbi:MAG: hypothetical protein VB110_08960 [Bacteroidales bacterium]|nr:hypothetical protein [Bacteroidales bacterium]
MNYIKTRRDDNVCNICGKTVSQLSWDHVPPKGGLDLSAVEIRNYTNSFDPKSKDRRESQNGLKFRTICKPCNEMLGTSYDKCFNALMNDVKDKLINSPDNQQVINIETKPTKIIKSILGHLLATKTKDCNLIIDRITKEYLFKENAILTNDIHVYCWIYPFDCTIIRNDVVSLDPMDPRTVYYSVIKSFPLGFAVSHECELTYGFTDITGYNYNDDYKVCKIPLYLNRQYNWDYPENLRYSGVQLIAKHTNDIFVTRKK